MKSGVVNRVFFMLGLCLIAFSIVNSMESSPFKNVNLVHVAILGAASLITACYFKIDSAEPKTSPIRSEPRGVEETQPVGPPPHPRDTVLRIGLGKDDAEFELATESELVLDDREEPRHLGPRRSESRPTSKRVGKDRDSEYEFTLDPDDDQ